MTQPTPAREHNHRRGPARPTWVLAEDGIVDLIAVDIAARGERRVRLTVTERQIAAQRILAAGGTRHTIAKHLHVSSQTARTLAAQVPEGIQLRRTKGWRKPPGSAVVARLGPWGNPYVVGASVPPSYGSGMVADAEHAVTLYRRHLARNRDLTARARWVLAGRDLACWCPTDQPCHRDVLLQVANPHLTAMEWRRAA